MITHTSGGDPIPAGCEIGTFTVAENSNSITINHSLGVVPKFAYCFCVPNDAWSDVIGGTILVEELGADPQTGDFDTSAGVNRTRNNVVTMSSNQYNTASTWTTYPADMTSTTVTFATGRYYSGQFKTGYTYLYVLTK